MHIVKQVTYLKEIPQKRDTPRALELNSLVNLFRLRVARTALVEPWPCARNTSRGALSLWRPVSFAYAGSPFRGCARSASRGKPANGNSHFNRNFKRGLLRMLISKRF